MGNNLYRISGSIEQKGAVPAAFNSTAEGQNARTAMPNMSGIEYSIKATNGTTTYSSEDGSGNIGIDGTSFTLALPQGTWTITVEGKLPGSTDAACVTGNANVTLSAENPVAQVNIAVKPSMNGTGDVALTVGVEDDSGINGVKWTLPDPVRSSGFIDLSTEKTGNITIDQIQSGSYTLVMEFYSGSSEDNQGQLLYMVRESVNVFDGATTDTWSGNSPYLNLSDGTFTVTKELVETFAQTTFYVSFDGDDSNSGSLPSSPLMTIQKAVDKAVAMNAVLPSDEDTPYRILLLSDVESDGTAFSAANNNAFVNIDPTKSLHLVIEPYKIEAATIDAKRNESNSGRVMYIGADAKVTMNSLTITGGRITAAGDNNSGGGIYSEGNCIFSSCIVSGNTATYGGGLNFSPASNDDGGNKLELTKCTIENNTAEDGGGILFCPASGSNEDISTTLKLTDCTISGNTATRDSGSVHGGGIYCYGKKPIVILDRGWIKNNTAGSDDSVADAYGGGIYSDEGTVTITGATISGNKAISSNQVGGGGLYLSGGTVGISGNSVISGNSCTTDNNNWGGGVYLDGSCSFTMGESEISNNSAKYGGGIYINSSDVTITNTSVSGNSSTTRGGGISIMGGSLTTTDMTLKNNIAGTVGGGIRIEGGTATITGGTISGNTATSGGGGGVSNNKTCTLNNVELKDNKAQASDGNGGAISNLGNATLTLNGGTIEGNTVEGNGGAIYNNGTLKVQGALSIPCGETGEHDVYLFNSENNVMTPITITGDLTTEGTVATITPGLGGYTEGVQVLQVDSGVSGVDLADQVGKFNVTPQPQDDGTITAWYISPEGTLTTKFYGSRLSEENYNSIEEITVGSAGDMNKISELASDGNTFVGKTITLQEDVTLDESYTPIQKFSGEFNGNYKTITLPSESPITALFTKVEGQDKSNLAEVNDLTVNGEATKAGIAAEATNAKISRCTSKVEVINTSIDSGMSMSYVGGIVGRLNATSTVENCTNTGSISSTVSAYVGGIVGRVNNESQILNCTNTVSVSGTGIDSYVGGIVGSAYNCYIVNCGNEGSVTGSSQDTNEDTRVGGIAGATTVPSSSSNYKGIYNCYNIGSVSGGKYVGGIAGDFGDERGPYGAYVCNTYNSGYVSSDVSGALIGGVIGRNNAGNQTHKIENNFYIKISSKPDNGVGTETVDDNNKTTAIIETTDTNKSEELNNWCNKTENKLTDINNVEISYKTWTYYDSTTSSYCKFEEE